MTPPRQKVDGDLREPSKNVPPPPGADLHPASGSAEEPPGVPGFATWRGVYLFVFIAFVVTVAALALFSRVYA
jgi:hypothetical protein